MNLDLAEKLAALTKGAEGEMPGMGGAMPMDQMAGGAGMGAPMGGGMPPLPTAEEIMAAGGGMGGAMPMDQMAGGAGMVDPMAGAMPAEIPIPEPIEVGPSPEEIAVDQSQADAMAAMGTAITAQTELMAQMMKTPSESVSDAADALVASPVGSILEPDDIPVNDMMM